MTLVSLTCACGRRAEIDWPGPATTVSATLDRMLRAGFHDPDECSKEAVRRKSAAEGVAAGFYARGYGSASAMPPFRSMLEGDL